jgi:AP-3 complex subunit delta-1
MGDETLGPDAPDSGREDIVVPRSRAKKSLLQVDSSGLGALSLDDDDGGNRKLTAFEMQRKEQEDAEMKRALEAVERSRLEMQRASERIAVGPETAVRKKKKKVRRVVVEGDEGGEDAGEAVQGEDPAPAVPKKKKKKVKPAEGAEGGGEGGAEPEKKKKKKKRVVALDD